MARNTSVSLGDHFVELIDALVESGRYNSASDVVRAGLRLLEREEKQFDWMRAQVADGVAAIETGDVHEESDSFWDNLDREVDDRMKRRDRSGAHVRS